MMKKSDLWLIITLGLFLLLCFGTKLKWKEKEEEMELKMHQKSEFCGIKLQLWDHKWSERITLGLFLIVVLVDLGTKLKSNFKKINKREQHVFKNANKAIYVGYYFSCEMKNRTTCQKLHHIKPLRDIICNICNSEKMSLNSQLQEKVTILDKEIKNCKMKKPEFQVRQYIKSKLTLGFWNKAFQLDFGESYSLNEQF